MSGREWSPVVSCVPGGTVVDSALALVLAESYLSEHFRGRTLNRLDVGQPNLDDGFCARVAAKLDALEDAVADPHVRATYLRFRAETRRQFALMTDAGVEVRPWLGNGQPYRNVADMCAKFADTGVLYVYLTQRGYGPDEQRDHRNPMLAESDVVIDGHRFLHNDVLRAVHDFFGHIMYGDDFSLRGELRAAANHFQLYSSDLHPALFNEYVAQICWFYAGPHLVSADGIIPQRSQLGWLSPRKRPYPPQKIVTFPDAFVADFLSRFRDLALTSDRS